MDSSLSYQFRNMIFLICPKSKERKGNQNLKMEHPECFGEMKIGQQFDFYV